MRKRPFRDDDPVDIDASELVGRVHDGLVASDRSNSDLDQWLVRLVFCLFADDTGIFEPRDSFLDFIETRTSPDGSDLGARLAELCQVLNTAPHRRSRFLDDDLARFPYVDGDLFRDRLLLLSFDGKTRKLLLDACRFDWSEISPAIFGSLFQSVMDQKRRRAQGAHYTTEKNILKVIEPLFLDDLRSRFERIRKRRGNDRRAALRAFHETLGELRFFDPACGCGNFLIVAYRELRMLEIEVIREMRAHFTADEQVELHAAGLSRIDVDQFYGIEIGAFPVRIAETALWMMDHLMNNRLSLEFGETYARIPLRKASRIERADALETDWAEVLPPERCSYLLGNPPFVGAKLQTPRQREQVRKAANLGGSGGTLDYVAAWFVRAAEYASAGSAEVGFVATNSIAQGEQPAQLWPTVLERHGMLISFAHQTFAWGSDARGEAHVHVAIVGLSKAPRGGRKRLFSYETPVAEPEESAHKAISPYLFDASRLRNPLVTVRETAQPLHDLPRLAIGSKPIDGGHYILTAEQRTDFLGREPEAGRYLRPYVGSHEFLHGTQRWILALHEASPAALRSLPGVRKRIAAVREFRLRSRSASTRALAETPRSFHVNVLPEERVLAIPETSSERRAYVPIAWLDPPAVPSNSLKVLANATLGDFALLTSAMHMSWLRHIGGRLKSDYRYSIGLVYNTFPLPRGGRSELARLAPLAGEVLAARRKHPDACLADLYSRDLMPAALQRAHQRLDRAVDRLYRRSSFASDRERAEHLLGRYERLATPLGGAGKPSASKAKAEGARRPGGTDPRVRTEGIA